MLGHVGAGVRESFASCFSQLHELFQGFEVSFFVLGDGDHFFVQFFLDCLIDFRKLLSFFFDQGESLNGLVIDVLFYLQVFTGLLKLLLHALVELLIGFPVNFQVFLFLLHQEGCCPSLVKFRLVGFLEVAVCLTHRHDPDDLDGRPRERAILFHLKVTMRVKGVDKGKLRISVFRFCLSLLFFFTSEKIAEHLCI